MAELIYSKVITKLDGADIKIATVVQHINYFIITMSRVIGKHTSSKSFIFDEEQLAIECCLEFLEN